MYVLACFSVPFQQFLKLPAVGGDEFLFQLTALDLDGNITLIADTFELAAGKSISSLTLLEAPDFGNVDCTVTITAFRDGKQIGTLNTELTLHTAYLWPKEVQ